jgi:hypothetical protein
MSDLDWFSWQLFKNNTQYRKIMIAQAPKAITNFSFLALFILVSKRVDMGYAFLKEGSRFIHRHPDYASQEKELKNKAA